MIANAEAVGLDLDSVYRDHLGAVLAHCRRILRNEDDAADAAHEVFLRAMQYMPAGRSTSEIRPWLLTVARNYCIDVLRQQKRLSRMENVDSGARQIDDPEQTTINRDTAATVMAGLRLHERRALWQSAVEGQPLAGIAHNLGLSYMAAAQVLHRARRRAVVAAAQVAAILWVLSRRPSPARAPAAGRLVAFIAVPALAVAITSATPPNRPMRPATPAVVAPQLAPRAGGIEADRVKPLTEQPANPATALTVEPPIPSTVAPASATTVVAAVSGLLNAPLLKVPSIVPISPPRPLPTPKIP